MLRVLVFPKSNSTKSDLRRALLRSVVGEERAVTGSEIAATSASPVRSAALLAALSVAIAVLEADKLPQWVNKAALEQFTRDISDIDFLGIAAALAVASRCSLKPMVDRFLSGKDPAATEAANNVLGI
jgi:hypothetical protein